MFHTPTDTRLQISPHVERLMASVGKPLPFSAGMDLRAAGASIAARGRLAAAN